MFTDCFIYKSVFIFFILDCSGQSSALCPSLNWLWLICIWCVQVSFFQLCCFYSFCSDWESVMILLALTFLWWSQDAHHCFSSELLFIKRVKTDWVSGQSGSNPLADTTTCTEREEGVRWCSRQIQLTHMLTVRAHKLHELHRAARHTHY